MDPKVKTGLIAVAIVGGLALIAGVAVLGSAIVSGLAAKPSLAKAGQATKPSPARPAPSPAPSAAGGTRSMSRAEFRSAAQGLEGLSGQKWSGVNGQGGRIGVIARDTGMPLLMAVGVYEAGTFDRRFGPPDRIRSERLVEVWSWTCRDGTVEVIVVPRASKDSRVELVGIDDL